MARTRQLSPKLFKDSDLAKLHPLTRLGFEGLWVLADCKGRLRDKPDEIKIDVLPYDDVDMNELLDELAAKLPERDRGFIRRYRVDGRGYIQIENFEKYQSNIHPNEMRQYKKLGPKQLPAPEEVTEESRLIASARDSGRQKHERSGTSRAEHLWDPLSTSVPSEPSVPSGSNVHPNGDGVAHEAVETKLPLPSATSALAPESPNPYRFVAYWQDANERRDYGMRVEPISGLEHFVVSKAEELGLETPRNELARMSQRSRERFVAEYQKLDRKNRSRGSRLSPKRLTEEFVAWVKKDLANAASNAARASARASPVTKEQHRNQDAEKRRQKIREAEERERHGEREHDTQRRGLAPR